MTAAAPARHITPPSERVSLRTKIAFGLGTSAESIVAAVISLSALYFYNNILKMPGTLTGLALMLSLVLDGIADPLVGSISDRTKGKLGRRHIYMYVAPLFSCTALALIFNPPDFLKELGADGKLVHQMELFAWLTCFIIVMRVSMAFFHVPHLAMGGELSRDYVERSRVMAFSSWFGWFGGAPMRFLALTFFFAATPLYPYGLANPAAHGPFAITAACIGFLCLMISTHFTRDQIPRLPQAPANLPKFSPFEFFKDMGYAFRNKNYVWLLIAYFFLSMTTGVRAGLDIYVNTHFWRLTSEELSKFIIGSFIGFIFAFLLAPRLHNLFDKKATIIVCAISYAVVPALPVTLHLLGLFPGHEDPMLLTWLISFAVFGYGLTAILTISVMSALADIADENELRFGVRQEGVLYATRTFFGKVDQAIGTFVVGVVLDLIPYPRGVKDPSEVPQEALETLAIVDSPVGAIPALIAVYFYSRFSITRHSYAKTRADLEAVRGERAAEPAAGA